jgi:CRISPR-associated protein Cas5h
MRIITWKLHGKMAHFRKFYSNSTFLSYYIPPVTTVKGFLAGLLGLERDSYYLQFSNENCKVAVGIGSKIKKITQTMNLLKVESLKNLNGQYNGRYTHVQNYTEWVVPQNIITGDVCYRLAVWHKDKDIMDKLEKCLCQKDDIYLSRGISAALGSVQCLCWVSGGCVCEATPCLSGNEPVKMDFAVPKNAVKLINFPKSGQCSILKEESITEFDKNRYITENSMIEVLLSANESPLLVNLYENTPYFKIENKNQNMMLLG